jgi:hypothetical protein
MERWHRPRSARRDRLATSQARRDRRVFSNRLRSDRVRRLEWRIAWHLGFASREHWLAEISPEQYAEAIAFAQLEPFGAPQDALLAAQQVVATYGAADRSVELSDAIAAMGVADHEPSLAEMTDEEVVRRAAML